MHVAVDRTSRHVYVWSAFVDDVNRVMCFQKLGVPVEDGELSGFFETTPAVLHIHNAAVSL